VFSEIGQPERPRIDDEQSEDAMTLRQVADRRSAGVVDPHCEELREPRSRVVENTEGAECRVDALRRSRDDPLQYGFEIPLQAAAEDGVEQPPELAWPRLGSDFFVHRVRS